MFDPVEECSRFCGLGGAILAGGRANLRLHSRPLLRSGTSRCRSFAEPTRSTIRWRSPPPREGLSPALEGQPGAQSLRSANGHSRWRRIFRSPRSSTPSEDRRQLGDADTFEIFESSSSTGSARHLRTRSCCRRPASGDSTAAGFLLVAAARHGYAALEQAVELRELLAAAELTMDSLDAGVERYRASWWRIDRAYRRCTLAPASLRSGESHGANSQSGLGRPM